MDPCTSRMDFFKDSVLCWISLTGDWTSMIVCLIYVAQLGQFLVHRFKQGLRPTCLKRGREDIEANSEDSESEIEIELDAIGRNRRAPIPVKSKLPRRGYENRDPFDWHDDDEPETGDQWDIWCKCKRCNRIRPHSSKIRLPIDHCGCPHCTFHTMRTTEIGWWKAITPKADYHSDWNDVPDRPVVWPKRCRCDWHREIYKHRGAFVTEHCGCIHCYHHDRAEYEYRKEHEGQLGEVGAPQWDPSFGDNIKNIG